MADKPLPPSWPRLAIDDAIALAARVLELSPAEALEAVDTNVEGHRFYATAPTRVNKSDLDDLRAEVVRLAESHGYPGERDRDARPAFDQELAVLFSQCVSMLPVEASDDEVWAFLTLKVLPDVAVWRWPAPLASPADSDLSIDDESDLQPAGASQTSRLDRLLGRRRGLFRQAWWRADLLGADACLLLDADNFIQLTDRVSLTGDRLIGPLIVQTHLSMVPRPGYDRRFGLRRAMVLIGRLLGRIAIDALTAEQARGHIESIFESVVDLPSSDTESQTADSLAPSVLAAEDAGMGVIDRFLAQASEYSEILRPLLILVPQRQAISMAFAAGEYARTLNGDLIAIRIADDLDRLVDDWQQFDEDECAVIHAALAYFLEEDDARSDEGPEGLLDDDEVVDAAFGALRRERGVG